MHFSIPDTQEFINESIGSTFTGFNIHINGSFHCCLRYKQLHSLHEQLRRSLSGFVLPPFPPKKLLPLTPTQVEVRRAAVERYIQLIGQDPLFSKSDLLRTFLLNAQQESARTKCREKEMDIYLANGYRLVTPVLTTECSSKVLAKACQLIDLPSAYVYYFALFLVRHEPDGHMTMLRKLMDFEAPFLSLRLASHECRVVIRKSYWDPCYDLELMHDKIAMNLLYVQTVGDIERGWIVMPADIQEKLLDYQERGAKKEYLEIARTLPAYGCFQFHGAFVNYPHDNTAASISVGCRELSIRTVLGKKIQETKFKVTRMRCWRVSTLHNNDELTSNTSKEMLGGRQRNGSGGSSSSNSSESPDNGVGALELAFEYLMAKSSMKWITIVSEQAMLMSVCLQSMVDEMLNQKTGNDINNTQIYHTTYPPLSFVTRDGSDTSRLSPSSSTDTISSLTENDTSGIAERESGNSSLHFTKSVQMLPKQNRKKFSTTVSFRNGRESVHNEAFEGIGDDDL